MINFNSKMRRISIIVRVVFMEGDVDVGRLRFVMGLSVRASLISGSLFSCICFWALGGWRFALGAGR